MQAVARIGDAFATGHACDGVSTIAGGSGSVFVNGIPASRRGDPGAVHDILVGDACVPHSTSISGGSGTVFADGISLARVGDAIDAGAIIAGSGNVFAGG